MKMEYHESGHVVEINDGGMVYLYHPDTNKCGCPVFRERGHCNHVPEAHDFYKKQRGENGREHELADAVMKINNVIVHVPDEAVGADGELTIVPFVVERHLNQRQQASHYTCSCTVHGKQELNVTPLVMRYAKDYCVHVKAARIFAERQARRLNAIEAQAHRQAHELAEQPEMFVDDAPYEPESPVAASEEPKTTGGVAEGVIIDLDPGEQGYTGGERTEDDLFGEDEATKALDAEAEKWDSWQREHDRQIGVATAQAIHELTAAVHALVAEVHEFRMQSQPGAKRKYTRELPEKDAPRSAAVARTVEYALTPKQFHRIERSAKERGLDADAFVQTFCPHLVDDRGRESFGEAYKCGVKELTSWGATTIIRHIEEQPIVGESEPLPEEKGRIIESIEDL